MLCRPGHPRFLIRFLFLYHSHSAFSSLPVCFCRQDSFCCPACLHIISFYRRLQDIRPLSCEQIRTKSDPPVICEQPFPCFNVIFLSLQVYDKLRIFSYK